MKRILMLVLCCLLLGALVLMVGCDENPATPPNGDLPQQPEDGGEQISLDCRVIFPNDASAMAGAVEIRRALSAVTGVAPDGRLDTDTQAGESADLEILVGATNRAESSAAMSGLKNNEYVIRSVGNTIVIVGGNDRMLEIAVNRFLLDYVGYYSTTRYTPNESLVLPSDIDVRQTVNQTDGVAILQLSDEADYIDQLRASISCYYTNVTVDTMSADPDDIFDLRMNQLVVLTGVQAAPTYIRTALYEYLSEGGRAMILGGPAFETLLYEYNGEFLTKSQYISQYIQDIADDQRCLLIDTTDDLVDTKFKRGSGNKAGDRYFYYGDFGLEGSECQMMYEVMDYLSWENETIGVTNNLKNANAIGFWAKSADDHTPDFYIELTDKNGARWTAVVQLSEEWEYRVLVPEDFTWWKLSEPTTLKEPNFTQIVKFSFGYADTAKFTSPGHHSFVWSEPTIFNLDDTFLNRINEILDAPAIDGISPLYEQYPITNAASIVTDDNQIFVRDRDYVVADSLISCYPGRQGTGYDKDKISRFIPLLLVEDEKGLHSGYAAWITLFCGPSAYNYDLEGAMVGCFSACSNDFYNTDGTMAVAEAINAMLQPAYLTEGGTDKFTYITVDEPTVQFGASYVDLWGADELEVTVALYRGEELLKEIKLSDSETFTRANGVVSFEGALAFADGQPDRAVTTLYLDGVAFDRIEQDVSYWEAKPESERHYVYIEDGYFKRDGEIINFYGINYVPTYNGANPVSSNFEVWTQKSSYDPEVVWRDLLRMKEIGFNAISLGLHAASAKQDSNNMLDVIRMCEELGLYVDLAIRGTTSYNDEFIYMPKTTLENLILLQHFQDNDMIVAYDINWERRVGSYNANNYLGRKRWDADWRQWITDQYGSIAHAEELWGCKAPRNSAGQVIGLSDYNMDSPKATESTMVAAYYRFMDDMIAKEFAELTNYIEVLDPNHLISFRMSMSGSALLSGEGKPSTGFYDFQSLASTMDFMSPEGYLILNNEESMMQIVFANAYARYTSPNAPVVWKEFSWNVWNGSSFNVSQYNLELEAKYYKLFLEHAYRSYTSAVYPWWNMGGYRINENSDFGIINPDGSDRPCTAVLREYADKFINQGERPMATTVLEIEREDGNKGIYSMYASVVEEMTEAYNNGETIAIVNKMQGGFEAGRYYADEMLTYAVGSTKAQGMFPLRYVNGQIKNVEVIEQNGQPCLKVTACNTLQSTWRAGTVSIVSTDESDVRVRTVIDSEVDYLEDVVLIIPISQKGRVTLRFEIDGIAFGMTYRTAVK